MKIDTEKIVKLLESDVSAYRIAQETGMSRTHIGYLRSGERDYMSLTLENADKLQKLYEDYKEKEMKLSLIHI